MLAFAVIAVVAGVRFLLPAKLEGTGARRGAPAILLAAVVVGFLTGLLGVGGGFLIVPALVLAVVPPIVGMLSGV